MGADIWVVCRSQGGMLDAGALELLTMAAKWKTEVSCTITPVCIGDRPQAVPKDFAHALWIECACATVPCMQGRMLARAAMSMCPSGIIASADQWYRSMMPVTAALLHTGLTADCTELEWMDSGSFVQTRPAFGGNLIARIATRTTPQMATVRTQGNKAQCALATPTVTRLNYPLENASCASIIRVMPESEWPNLQKASIIVGIGAGVGTKENVALVYELATALHGVVAASRKAVNMGLMPYNRQVGQSGRTVAPDVYIALGISGAVQHLAGIRKAKVIIGVNNDPHAPIFDHADLGVVADWKDYTQQLLRELKEHNSALIK